jgi:phage-related minor tail protein
MASQAASASIFEALGSGLQGQGGFVGAIGSFFSSTTRATGGPLEAGQAAIVGERGKELFIPDRPGTVVANDQLGSMGNITVQVTAPPGNANSQSPAQFGFEIAQALRLATGRNG